MDLDSYKELLKRISITYWLTIASAVIGGITLLSCLWRVGIIPFILWIICWPFRATKDAANMAAEFDAVRDLRGLTSNASNKVYKVKNYLFTDSRRRKEQEPDIESPKMERRSSIGDGQEDDDIDPELKKYLASLKTQARAKPASIARKSLYTYALMATFGMFVCCESASIPITQCDQTFNLVGSDYLLCTNNADVSVQKCTIKTSTLINLPAPGSAACFNIKDNTTGAVVFQQLAWLDHETRILPSTAYYSALWNVSSFYSQRCLDAGPCNADSCNNYGPNQIDGEIAAYTFKNFPGYSHCDRKAAKNCFYYLSDGCNYWIWTPLPVGFKYSVKELSYSTENPQVRVTSITPDGAQYTTYYNSSGVFGDVQIGEVTVLGNYKGTQNLFGSNKLVTNLKNGNSWLMKCADKGANLGGFCGAIQSDDLNKLWGPFDDPSLWSQANKNWYTFDLNMVKVTAYNSYTQFQWIDDPMAPYASKQTDFPLPINGDVIFNNQAYLSVKPQNPGTLAVGMTYNNKTQYTFFVNYNTISITSIPVVYGCQFCTSRATISFYAKGTFNSQVRFRMTAVPCTSQFSASNCEAFAGTKKYEGATNFGGTDLALTNYMQVTPEPKQYNMTFDATNWSPNQVMIVNLYGANFIKPNNDYYFQYFIKGSIVSGVIVENKTIVSGPAYNGSDASSGSDISVNIPSLSSLFGAVPEWLLNTVFTILMVIGGALIVAVVVFISYRIIIYMITRKGSKGLTSVKDAIGRAFKDMKKINDKPLENKSLIFAPSTSEKLL